VNVISFKEKDLLLNDLWRKCIEVKFKWEWLLQIPNNFLGKPANSFAYDGALKDRAFALQIIHENHHEWHNLMKNGHSAISSHHSIGHPETASQFKVASADAASKLNLKAWLW